MPLISKTITGMYGGVSQQPAALRIDNQCEEMTNCLPTLVDGVYKRPPTEFVKTLKTRTPSSTQNLKVHFIDRDAVEKYAVLFTGISDDPIEVYSLTDGVEKAVAYANAAAKTYATTTTPRESIKCITIGDYTVVANSAITAAMTNVQGGTWKPFGIVNVLHGVAGTDYLVYINGAVAGNYTSGATDAYATYKTSTIASALYDDIVAWQATQDVPNDWEVVYGGSSILIFNNNDDDFTFKVEDSWGNAALVGIKEQAPKLEDLPNRLPDNATFGTDVFAYHGQSEYYMDIILVVDDTQNGEVMSSGLRKPHGYRELAYSVEGYGHEDSDIYEAADYLQTALIKCFQDPAFAGAPPGGSGHAGSAVVWDAPQVGDQWYSTDWEIHRDDLSHVSAWRTDDIRTKLYFGRRHLRDGNWGDLTMLKDGVESVYLSASQAWAAYDYHSADVCSVARHESVDFANMAVKIYGEGTKTDFIGYYLRWKTETSDGMNATGAWSETMKGGLYNNIDATLAPHQLVRQGDGTFIFQAVTWEARTVGDMDSAPNPSWIGNPINDVFFHKNRVGFLAGGNVCLSKSDDYWDFFPTTALEILDDDPIDITIPSTGVDALRWAIPNKGDLLIFGPSDEYILTSGDQVFGVKTASMDSNVNFPISATAQPVRVGANVYFVSPKGEYAAVHEYFTQPQTLTDDAADVAAHAPKYVPNYISSLTGSSTFNIIFLCGGDDQTVYVYKYYWAGDQKAQSAWFKWTFAGQYVKAVTVIDNYLYLIGDTGAAFTLERINLERINDASLAFGVHLDHKQTFDATGSYSGATGDTTWTITHPFLNELLMEPYLGAGGSDWCLFNLDAGKEIDGLHWADATHVHVLGDYSAVNVAVGLRYSQTFTFSEFGVPAPKGNVYSPQGRLQLRTLNVSFKETPMFEVIVTPTGTTEGGRSAITHDYSGVEMGLATLGSVQLTSARKRFLIWANAIGVTIQLRNTSPYPATWYEASWEAMYTTRNQGIA